MNVGGSRMSPVLEELRRNIGEISFMETLAMGAAH